MFVRMNMKKVIERNRVDYPGHTNDISKSIFIGICSLFECINDSKVFWINPSTQKVKI